MLRFHIFIREFLFGIIIASIISFLVNMNLVLNFIGMIISGFIGAFIALWLDSFNNPDLEIIASEEANTEVVYSSNHPVPGRCKFFRLLVKNKEIPRFLPKKLFNRETAEQLNAEITFEELDKTMKGRWSGTLELPFANPQDLMRLANFPEPENIQSGKQELLDVFAKFEKDKEGYGWNNEAYLFNWKTPHYRLDEGIYKVKVVIIGLNVSKNVSFEIKIAAKIEDSHIKKI